MKCFWKRLSKSRYLYLSYTVKKELPVSSIGPALKRKSVSRNPTGSKILGSKCFGPGTPKNVQNIACITEAANLTQSTRKIVKKFLKSSQTIGFWEGLKYAQIHVDLFMITKYKTNLPSKTEPNKRRKKRNSIMRNLCDDIVNMYMYKFCYLRPYEAIQKVRHFK